MNQENYFSPISSSHRMRCNTIGELHRRRTVRRRRERRSSLINILPNKQKGLAKKNYRKLKKLKIMKSSRKCPICFENFKKEEVIIQLPCQHIFHRNCCKNWVLKNSTCPVCRDKLNTYFDTDVESSICNSDAYDELE